MVVSSDIPNGTECAQT